MRKDGGAASGYAGRSGMAQRPPQHGHWIGVTNVPRGSEPSIRPKFGEQSARSKLRAPNIDVGTCGAHVVAPRVYADLARRRSGDR